MGNFESSTAGINWGVSNLLSLNGIAIDDSFGLEVK